VLGLEGDIAWSNARGSVGNPINPPFGAFLFTDESQLGWFATFTGRVGYAWERTLFYAKAGLAVAEVTQSVRSNVNGNLFGTATSHLASGWTAGVGTEYALNAAWSAKAEYLYYDLGTDNYANVLDAHARGGLARVGLNFRASPLAPAVMAKY
jgi:outer membrane immunogenic protein